MNNLLGLGVFGTFGKPYGFQQYFYFDTDFNQTLDLNTNAIEIFPSTELFSIKREIYNGLNSICIIKYSYANEINSSRGGTFIGSCILLNEAYTSSENIYLLLTELHNDLISSEKNLINSVLQVQQATQLEVKEPIHFESVKNQLTFLKETDFYSTSVNQSKKFLIVPKSNEDKATQIKTFIENSIQYFNDVDTLYFTFDEKVISYVNQKGLLKSINWQTFVDRKEEVIKERAEIKRIEEERKRELERNKNSKNSSNKDGSFSIWNYRNEKKWERNQIKKAIDEYNRLLDEYNRLFIYCSELENQKTNTPKQVNYRQSHYERQSHSEPEGIFEENKFLFSVILNILFTLFIVIYFVFFNKPEIRHIDNSPEVTEQTETEETENVETETQELKPTPNDELNSISRNRIENTKLRGKNIRSIIETIFQQNPNEIQAHYKYQREVYIKELVKRNRDCFKQDNEDLIFICDSLLHIPKYKKISNE
jgi:hypothetical protein